MPICCSALATASARPQNGAAQQQRLFLRGRHLPEGHAVARFRVALSPAVPVQAEQKYHQRRQRHARSIERKGPDAARGHVLRHEPEAPDQRRQQQ